MCGQTDVAVACRRLPLVEYFILPTDWQALHCVRGWSRQPWKTVLYFSLWWDRTPPFLVPCYRKWMVQFILWREQMHIMRGMYQCLKCHSLYSEHRMVTCLLFSSNFIILHLPSWPPTLRSWQMSWLAPFHSEHWSRIIFVKCTLPGPQQCVWIFSYVVLGFHQSTATKTRILFAFAHCLPRPTLLYAFFTDKISPPWANKCSQL